MKTKDSRSIRSFLIIFTLILSVLLLLSARCKNNHESTFPGPEIKITVIEDIDDSGSDQSKDPGGPSLKVLTQNTMLIPFDFVAPAFSQRTGHIIDLVQDNFDIVCLQEVFDGNSQNRIASSWHEMVHKNTAAGSFDRWQIDYFDQWYDLLPEKNKKMWHPLAAAEDIGVLAKKESLQGVKVIDTSVNDIGAELVFSPYYVMGPDRGRLNIRQDGGLMILSRYPITGCSSLTYEKSSGSDRLANKGAIYARIQVGPSSGDYIHVFNTHIQAHDYGETRLEQIKELMAFIREIVRSDSGKAHPIIMAGDFNVTAEKTDGWMEVSGTAPPEDEAGSNYNNQPSQEYEDFLGIIEDFSKDLTNTLSGRIDLKDSWLELNPWDPGFTWIGKDWITGDKNPYGSIGNRIAISNGGPKRIDYIFYFEGSGPLKLEPASIDLVPEKPDLLYCFDRNTQITPELSPGPHIKTSTESECSFKSYTVSDHLGLTLAIDLLEDPS